MKLRVLIADDEPLSRIRLREFIHAEAGAEVVAECATGMEAVDGIRAQCPDLVFLDIKMPELDGFGVVAAFDGTPLPAIIFVTAYDKFAVRAFETNAVDYLLKPFDRERFQRAFKRARQRLRIGSTDGDAEFLTNLRTPAHPARQPLERLTIKSHGRFIVVDVADLDWVCAADNYVELHTGKTTHLLRMTLRALADRLPSKRWVQISRSHLVNLERVREIHPKSHGDYDVVLHNGTRLGGTRTYRDGLKTTWIR